MDTLGTPQLETTHSSQAHGHLPPLMIGVLLWETGRWRWVKTDQVSGGWVGLVLNPASGRGASLRQAETDSSRDMIIYRVDIGAFGGGEERWLLGEAWTYFPLGVFSLGSGCFFLDVTGRDCPPPHPPAKEHGGECFFLATDPQLIASRLPPQPCLASGFIHCPQWLSSQISLPHRGRACCLLPRAGSSATLSCPERQGCYPMGSSCLSSYDWDLPSPGPFCSFRATLPGHVFFSLYCERLWYARPWSGCPLGVSCLVEKSGQKAVGNRRKTILP